MIFQPLKCETNPSWDNQFQLWMDFRVRKFLSLVPFLVQIIVLGPLRTNEFFLVTSFSILIYSRTSLEVFSTGLFSLDLMKNISLFEKIRCMFFSVLEYFLSCLSGGKKFSLWPCSKLRQIWKEYDIWSFQVHQMYFLQES